MDSRTRSTSRRALRRALAALLATVAVVGTHLVGPSASAVIPERSIAVGPNQGHYTQWSGTVPSGSGVVCAPLDIRCDHTLVQVQGFEGSVPCVGVTATSKNTGRGLHIAAYEVVPGVGVGDQVATAHDGTLLFWGEPGAVYLISVGSYRTTGTSTGFPYSAAIGTRDVGLGPGIQNGDWLLCVPGAWAAETSLRFFTDGAALLPR